MRADSKIYVAGHQGMVGSSVVRLLAARGYRQVITCSQADLDLRDYQAVYNFMAMEKPEVVIIAAARVGGIHANSRYPVAFFQDNMAIAQNMMTAAYAVDVKRLLFLGSSCIYPRESPQPISEDCLLTSPLEPTNEAYALAKIAGLKLASYYRREHGALFHSLMPTNLYGPGDNYHPKNSHVIPALLRRFHEAKVGGMDTVTLWGSGRPRREFLYVDDLARAILFVLQIEEPPDWLNVGTGVDMTIRELAAVVREVVGFSGELVFDGSYPDGTMRKLLDCKKINALGWFPKIDFKTGIAQAYQDFQQCFAAGLIRQ